MKSVLNKKIIFTSLIIAGFIACTSSSSSSSATRTVNSLTSDGSSISTAFGGTCVQLTRDVSSCKSSREDLGLSDDWLSFSCNVELGLADSSKNSVTSYDSATYITVTFTGVPAHPSNFFPSSGSYSFDANDYTVTGDYTDRYEDYTPTSANPNTLAQQSFVLYIPKSPSSSTHANKGLGVTGVTIDGIPIYSSLASGSDNIFKEAGSFDQCQGHPDSSSKYHYHSEPYSVNYQSSNVIGIMRDGYFIYGRYDYGGSTDLDTSNTSSDEFIYGGHVGTVPSTGTGSVFHYHVVYAKGCDHRTTDGSTIYADDGNYTTDSATNPCTGPTTGGTTVEVYFLSGFGNGGIFMTVPTASDNSGTMKNSTAASRSYYGSMAGDCTGC